jgi:hypothetical protein
MFIAHQKIRVLYVIRRQKRRYSSESGIIYYPITLQPDQQAFPVEKPVDQAVKLLDNILRRRQLANVLKLLRRTRGLKMSRLVNCQKQSYLNCFVFKVR